ncbi:MAG: peptidylprolyl isomerase [Proteobacteria bacterium]|nr:peptidylprolyl isomerase [Pseudomonadota bacterium]
MIRFSLLLLTLFFVIPGAKAAQQSIDSIVAIVDEDVVTKRELDSRIELIRVDFAQSGRTLPEPDTLYRQVLEIMISDSILLQQAKNRGLRITDGQLNQAMQNMARENSMNLSEFRQALIGQGIDYARYRESFRKEMAIGTLQRQFTARTVEITDAEVEDFINRTGSDTSEYEYRLAHILIALPDAASSEQVDSASQTVQQLLERLDQGARFEQLANEFSAGANALQGGDLGWRKKAEIPGLFSNEVLNMEPGEYAGPLRSASGFHIVSLVERRDLEQVLTEQTRTRHILIRPNELISEDEAKNRLQSLRERILAGEDFARLARLFSVDYTSGSQGGDIGWSEAGTTVPEYESVAGLLEPGQISEPFRSQFGWHLLEVTGRRTIDETKESKFNKIHSQLLLQKRLEAFDIWKRRLRDEAYVIFPTPDA